MLKLHFPAFTHPDSLWPHFPYRPRKTLNTTDNKTYVCGYKQRQGFSHDAASLLNEKHWEQNVLIWSEHPHDLMITVGFLKNFQLASWLTFAALILQQHSHQFLRVAGSKSSGAGKNFLLQLRRSRLRRTSPAAGVTRTYSPSDSQHTDGRGC